jgi:hypothetical protein
MNYCDTCNAGNGNDISRVIRCGTCIVRPNGEPSNYIPVATKESAK